jgi:hypothetical protein
MTDAGPLPERCACGHRRASHPSDGTCLVAVSQGAVCPCPTYQPATAEPVAA